MIYLDNKVVITVMSGTNQPILVVKDGDIVHIKTLDCFSNRLKKEDDTLGLLEWDSINPCTGPIYVDGAEKGDILKVEIIDMEVDNHGVILMDESDMRRYGVRGKEKSLHVTVEKSSICLSKKVQLPIQPMIGVIGTAPELGDIPTTLPGRHGGNMDCKCIKKGSIVYLPVFHEGGLLAVGDLHAAMGDGEAAGSGIEISGAVIIKINIIKNQKMPLPLISFDGKIATIASEESLEKASDLSVKMMLDFLTQNKGYDLEYAWKLLTYSADVCICQFANKIKTVRCEIPLSVIGHQ